MKVGRQCVFCGSAAGSLEHAWPEWLQAWMNPKQERRVVQLPTGKVVDAYGWGVATHRHVCGTCNTWMGKAYEGQASSLIQTLNDAQAKCTISSGDQRLLANWAYKTTLMLECTNVNGPGVERGECVRFRNIGRPPSDCSIILGCSDHSALAYHRSLVFNDDGARVGYATMMAVGRLFFHLLGDTRALNSHGRLFATHISERHVAPLYPGSGRPINWPLNGYFTKAAVEGLASVAGETFRFVT